MRAVLFDLDDTLLDYSSGVDRCWETAFRTAAPPGLDAAALLPVLAETRRWFWSEPERHRAERVDMLRAWTRIAAHTLERAGRADARAAAQVAEAFAASRRATMRLFPDARACLERLRRRDVALALVTNGDARQQRDKIERHGLASFFQAIVIEGEFGRGKPDAAVYEAALRALGRRADEACMVGDNLEWDVAGPQRLGLTGVWIDRAGSGLPTGATVQPDRIIGDLTTLEPAGRA
ncbi:MAG: HAD family hydrolase [Candidatus Rokuibacteriota bacterium]